jgi:replicative DNA helicase
MIQLQVLNYIIQKSDYSFISENNFTEKYFSDYKSEYRFIMDHYRVYGNIPDVATLLANFPNFDVIEVNESREYLTNELIKDYQTRQFSLLFNKIKPLVLSGDLNTATQQAREILDEMSSTSSIECVDILKDLSRYDAYLERTQDFKKYYISTGFKELDAIIGGWDRQEELATIVARTNYGKSWVLLKSALASAEQGLNVGIYSGEMSERKVGYRLDTLLGHINNGALVHGNLSVQIEYQKYIESIGTKCKGSIKVLTPQMINGPADVNALRSFIDKEKLDVLFIDQLSLLEDARKGKSSVEKASNISKDLKILQVMKRIPIISVSQQNRTSTESGQVDTTQIAQSDRIGQDSTCIIFIEKKDDIMKLTLVKSRDSENGKSLSYQVDLNKGNFIYIPNENDANEGKTEVDYSSRYDTDEENGSDKEW